MAKSYAPPSRSTPAASQSSPPEGETQSAGNQAALEAFSRATSGGGAPLDAGLASLSGMDLAGVRVHTGRSEIRDAGANALTDGTDIAFADTNPSRRTILHELGHVRDHAAGGGGSGVSAPGDASERRADRVADAALSGRALPAAGSPGAGLHGDWLDDAAGWVGDRVGDAFDSRTDEERLDAEEDLADFMAQDYSLQNYTSAHNTGNFDANYNPRSGQMTISLRVFFDFQNGDPTDAGWLADRSGPGAPAADFQWTDAEKQAYAANFIQECTSVWSHQYTFFSTRPHWDALPGVNVNINVTQAADAAASHFHLEVRKWPENRSGGDHMDRLGANHGPAHAGHQGTDAQHNGGLLHESAEGGAGELDVSNFVRNTNTRSAYGAAATANPGTITFAQNDATVDPTQTTSLRTFAAVMARPEMPDFPITLTGHSSSEGTEERNQRLSEDRSREVSNILVTSGVKSQPTSRGVGETGATEDPVWRRVDVTLGNFTANQRTAVHEFGHMIGLGDEYPDADTTDAAGNTVSHVGEEAEHSDLAEEFGLVSAPVVRTHTDNVMSNGEVVRPQHYATFLDALARMTGIRDSWSTSPAGPSGPGDFVGPNPNATTGMA